MFVVCGLAFSSVLREIVSPPRPSSVVCVSLSVFNDAPLASMLASHAQALSISGKVRHVSVKHTLYTLLFPKSSTEAEEKLRRFLKWVKERTPVLVGGVQPPGNDPCCVLLVDPESCSEAELESCEADLISLLQTGRLAVMYASPQVQQAIELLREREIPERSSLHSLGRSGELPANE
ncbi:hypothetical protein HYH03_008121 [Edaphochlamys debaryana]|uniref:Uncharacterized protein n=1 Tax=Edaphochlamys debaryana TaxID=47281 RepID=A0A835Y1K9_9CHLO|nr:hypothetical protein HYH03_008121 [Edaphochlamys debaryana]|eukprot:KAG2493604.1 hypothetical protein HYH03_008121 [Edaphochlamys debaryana]